MISAKKNPDVCEYNHGYHRACYSRFTGNLNRLTEIPENEPSTSQGIHTRRQSTDKDKIIFKPDCLFCKKEGRKKVKVKGVWTSEETKLFDRGGGQCIVTIAEQKGDFELLRRIFGCDLFECEARYNPSCRRKYVVSQDRGKSRNDEDIKQQEVLE